MRAYEVLAEPRPAVVLETLGGETLAHLLLRRSRRLPARELGFLGAHLCSAVGYLHGQGHLHLDLKPSNVVADGGRAKLIDLSIARRPGRVKAGLGTWCYLSPEQAQGAVVGPEADVWGLGVVLWEAATGTRAFGDDRDDDVDLPVLHRRADPVRSLRPPAAGAARRRDRRMPGAGRGGAARARRARCERRQPLTMTMSAATTPAATAATAPRPSAT